MLALQAPNGQWGGDSYHPYWTSTTYTLLTLRDLGLDPNSEQARRAIKLVRDNVQFQWTETDFKPFFEGETDTCINGMVVALGSYFGEPSTSLVERLLDEHLDDGGWNCWAGEAWPDQESTRCSFNTTISVLEALLEYEKSVAPDPEVTKARARGHEYLLERRLFRRLSTGEVIEPEWPKTSDLTRFSFPPGISTTCCGGWTICGLLVSIPNLESMKPSSCSLAGETPTVAGRARTFIRAKFISKWKKGRASRAGGPPCELSGC